MKLTPNNTDLYTLLHLEGGTLLYDGSEGSVVRAANNGTVLTDILHGDDLCRILHELALEDFHLICLKSKEVQRLVLREFGFTGEQFCSQWVYTKPKPPILPPCDIRPLTLAELPIAAAHYHPEDNNFEYLRGRISHGRMWGLYENGVLAGFVGTHTEGSMGILEVFPEYRRRGYGEMLEAYLIAWLMERGHIPYGQVVEGNTASLGLQAKLGLERCELPAIWMWKE